MEGYTGLSTLESTCIESSAALQTEGGDTPLKKQRERERELSTSADPVCAPLRHCRFIIVASLRGCQGDVQNTQREKSRDDPKSRNIGFSSFTHSGCAKLFRSFSSSRD